MTVERKFTPRLSLTTMSVGVEPNGRSETSQSEAGVAENKAQYELELQVPEGAHARSAPDDGVRRGEVPEYSRVLGRASHRDVHDPWRHVHAPLQILRREDRVAARTRP